MVIWMLTAYQVLCSFFLLLTVGIFCFKKAYSAVVSIFQVPVLVFININLLTDFSLDFPFVKHHALQIVCSLLYGKN